MTKQEIDELIESDLKYLKYLIQFKFGPIDPELLQKSFVVIKFLLRKIYESKL